MFSKSFSLLALLGLLQTNLLSASNEVLYNSCRFCHGEKGEMTYLGKVEPIKRLDKTALVTLLQSYKKGEIDQIGLGKLMQAQIANFNDADIEQLSAYIASF
ncbi:c-type cytochrome [Sulfurospirillum sp. 'SP']|nr:cytochrome c [Sulfurospirillum sp. 'SP']WNZ00061.1 c-type cytochrome [Sulfurospirillum sp. 'SP']